MSVFLSVPNPLGFRRIDTATNRRTFTKRFYSWAVVAKGDKCAHTYPRNPHLRQFVSQKKTPLHSVDFPPKPVKPQTPRQHRLVDVLEKPEGLLSPLIQTRGNNSGLR